MFSIQNFASSGVIIRRSVFHVLPSPVKLLGPDNSRR
nr:MAG TPA: hypothetical protein [Caudoviricetes sp.]